MKSNSLIIQTCLNLIAQWRPFMTISKIFWTILSFRESSHLNLEMVKEKDIQLVISSKLSFIRLLQTLLANPRRVKILSIYQKTTRETWFKSSSTKTNELIVTTKCYSSYLVLQRQTCWWRKIQENSWESHPLEFLQNQSHQRSLLNQWTQPTTILETFAAKLSPKVSTSKKNLELKLSRLMNKIEFYLLISNKQFLSAMSNWNIKRCKQLKVGFRKTKATIWITQSILLHFWKQSDGVQELSNSAKK